LQTAFSKGINIIFGAAVILTTVLYRIYHGFLTAEKGTMEFSHTKDCTGKRLLLLNGP